MDLGECAMLVAQRIITKRFEAQTPLFMKPDHIFRNSFFRGGSGLMGRLSQYFPLKYRLKKAGIKYPWILERCLHLDQLPN